MSGAREEARKLILELWSVPSESRTDDLVELLNVLLPDPEWSDSIYHSDEFVDENEELKVEELLDKVFSYRSIQL